MIKYFKNKMNQRRERKLRTQMMFSFGRENDAETIQAWTEFALYNKPTRLLLSTMTEHGRMSVLSERYTLREKQSCEEDSGSICPQS